MLGSHLLGAESTCDMRGHSLLNLLRDKWESVADWD